MKNSPEIYQEASLDYERVAQAIRFLCANQQQAPSLNDTAEHVHLSPEHFQKLFSRWAGVSPKQFTQYLRKEYAIKCLHEQSMSLQKVALDSGLSGSGRLHDLMIQTYGMTPKDYSNAGKNLSISYGFHPSPFGYCLIANTEKGICKLAFFDSEAEKQNLIKELTSEWSLANLVHDQLLTQKLLSKIFNLEQKNKKIPLKLLLKGTSFQLKVWEALLSIPSGKLCAYSDLAKRIDQDNATRAVSSAVAKNNIALLIPCHRVIRQSGEFNQYRWGALRKQAMIAWEASQTINTSSSE